MMKNISVILFIFVVVMPMTAKESGESIIRYSQNGTVRSVEFSKMKQDMTIPKSVGTEVTGTFVPFQLFLGKYTKRLRLQL